MSSSSSPIRVLTVGFLPSSLPSSFTSSLNITPEQVRLGIEQDKQRMEKAGVVVSHHLPSYDSFLGASSSSSSVSSALDSFVSVLNSFQPTAVCIGYGIRSRPEFDSTLELIVNAIIEYSPQVKILFNRSPSSTGDAVKRWFNIELEPLDSNKQ